MCITFRWLLLFFFFTIKFISWSQKFCQIVINLTKSLKKSNLTTKQIPGHSAQQRREVITREPQIQQNMEHRSQSKQEETPSFWLPGHHRYLYECLSAPMRPTKQQVWCRHDACLAQHLHPVLTLPKSFISCNQMVTHFLSPHSYFSLSFSLRTKDTTQYLRFFLIMLHSVNSMREKGLLINKI